MPAIKLTGTRGLAKVREEREALDARERQYRREAATELGDVVLAAGAETFPGAELKAILVAAKAVGPTRAIEALQAAQAVQQRSKTTGTGLNPAAGPGVDADA